MAAYSYKKSQLYVAWAGSVLGEAGKGVGGVEELLDPTLLGLLIDTLWPPAKIGNKQQGVEDKSPEGRLKVITDYITGLGVKHAIQPEALLQGDIKTLLDLLWILILHLGIHTPRQAAFQRNTKMGRRLALNWCRELLPEMTVDHNETLVTNLARGPLLTELISTFCSVKRDADKLTNLENSLSRVQEKFGISKKILKASSVLEGTVSEEALLIYISLLRRRVKRKEIPGASAVRHYSLTAGLEAGASASPRLAWTI